jgi:hypothetical protein
MIKHTVEGLGELTFFVNKGAVSEFEDYFSKPWINIVMEGMTSKHWFVLIHKCYEIACYRLKKDIEYSVKDFQASFTDEDYKTLVNSIDLELVKVLEIDKLTEELNKQVKKKAR